MKALLFFLALTTLTPCIATTEYQMTELKTVEEFEALTGSSTPSLVVFTAYWCTPCNMLKKRLKEVQEQYGYAQEDIQIRTVDAYKNETLRKYLLKGYPTGRIFKGGKLMPEQFSGLQSENFLRAFIDSVIATYPPQGAIEGAHPSIP